MKETVILHLSDLHFGRSFQKQKWKELKAEAVNLAPDVILITGDLVNTPWPWKLREAKDELQSLIDAIRALEGKKNAQLFTIPGNHDTRVSGLIAVKWLKYSFLASGLISGMLFCSTHITGLSYWKLNSYTWLTFDGLVNALAIVCALCSAVLRALTTTQLKTKLSPFLLEDVKPLPDVGIGIIPFDSASAAKLGAHGRVPNDVSIKCQRVATFNDANVHSPLFWIAAVHHHALPLPYDSEHESIMIMENAGTLLQELIKRRVPLILHGHKHHQHFARLLTRNREGEDREIAVLSAPTPTERFNQGAFNHGFNVLYLRENHELEIISFEAEAGASFSKVSTVSVTSSSEYARRRFEALSRATGISCLKMVSSADIDEYGDVSLSREFSHLKSTRDLHAFPHAFESQSDSGEITYVSAYVTSDNSPGADIEVSQASPHLVRCNVKFTGDILRPSAQPLDFQFRALATNAFALTSSQHTMLYPNDTTGSEYMIYMVPECLAVRELILQLRFPRIMSLPKSVVLQVSTSVDSHIDDWSSVSSDCVTYMHSLRSVTARIEAPRAGFRYRFLWHVEKDRPSLSGKLESRLNKLDQRRDKQVAARLIQEIVGHAVKSLASDGLRSDDRLGDICVTLYRFNRPKAKLEAFCTSGPASHPPGTYGYGAGLPGRAFKRGTATVFDRDVFVATAEAENRGIGRGVNIREEISTRDVAGISSAFPPDDIRPGDPTSEVGTALAFPIFEGGEAHRQPFCIVAVSVDGEGGQLKLEDTHYDRAHSDFQQDVFRTLQKSLPKNRTGDSHANRSRQNI